MGIFIAFLLKTLHPEEAIKKKSAEALLFQSTHRIVDGVLDFFHTLLGLLDGWIRIRGLGDFNLEVVRGIPDHLNSAGGHSGNLRQLVGPKKHQHRKEQKDYFSGADE